MSAWATEQEREDHLHNTTYAPVDFRVYDETDNGEFITTATVDLIFKGRVVETKQFVASSEDAPGEGFSAYWNGRDNHASTQARSYAWAWVESAQREIDAARLSVKLDRDVHPLELADWAVA